MGRPILASCERGGWISVRRALVACVQHAQARRLRELIELAYAAPPPMVRMTGDQGLPYRISLEAVLDAIHCVCLPPLARLGLWLLTLLTPEEATIAWLMAATSTTNGDGRPDFRSDRAAARVVSRNVELPTSWKLPQKDYVARERERLSGLLKEAWKEIEHRLHSAISRIATLPTPLAYADTGERGIEVLFCT